MMYTAQKYIEWYNALALKSSQANANLLCLEASEESWNIAKDLLMNPSYFLHGCQLMSKKLNQPILFSNLQLQKLEQFLFSFQKPHDLIYYCRAKIHLHLARRQIKISPKSAVPQQLIKILLHLPEAMKSIRAVHTQNLKQITEETFSFHKEHLIQNFKNFTVDILKCLDNYVSSNIKLKSSDLVKLLLTQQIQEVGIILEEILLHESYPSINAEILEYLNSINIQQHLKDFFPVYLAFCRSFSLIEMPYNFVHSVLEKILNIMKLDSIENEYNYIIQTFEFWSDLSMKMQEKKTENTKMFCDAYVEVWKLVIQKSIFQTLPEVNEKKEHDPLSLQDDFDHQSIELPQSQPVNAKFRNSSEDFIILCFRTLKSNKQYIKNILSFVYELICSQNKERIELSIFILQIIVGMISEEEKDYLEFASQLIGLCMSSKIYCENLYIAKQLLKLIGQAGLALSFSNKTLTLCLQTLSFCLKYEYLSSLASDALVNMLNECERVNQQTNLSELLEVFFKETYQTTYLQTSSQKCFHNLTKVFVNFIYKLKKNQEVFKTYLIAFYDKIKNCSAHYKRSFLETLVSSHISVGSEKSSLFTPILAEFILPFNAEIVENIIKAKTQEEQNKSYILLKLIMLSVGGYFTSQWISWIKAILNESSTKRSLLSPTIIIIFRVLEAEDVDSKYKATISQFLHQIMEPLTKILLSAESQQITLIKNLLLVHLTIMRKHLDVYSLNPQNLLNFIMKQVIGNTQFKDYETTRTSLAILLNMIQKQYNTEKILFQTLKAYPRHRALFPTSIMGILFQTYKQKGMQIFYACLKEVKPQLLPPNPLWSSFEVALAKNETKTIQNILLCLS